MTSVIDRIKQVKQPYGGYLPRKSFKMTQFNDGEELYSKENISSSLVSLAIDSLTRFMMGIKPAESFATSLKGAYYLDNTVTDLFTMTFADEHYSIAKDLLAKVKGLDEQSIINACKLVGYNVCYQVNPSAYKPIELINPDNDTIHNIEVMVNRNINFWKKNGPIITNGFDFESGYTDFINSGNGDYLTEDTLWDFKVSKSAPTSNYTLQILIYYIMGMHSTHRDFINIKKLGLFNPRLNRSYLVAIKSLSSELLQKVEKNVIGYPNSMFLEEKNISSVDVMDNGQLINGNVYFWKNYLVKINRGKVKVLSRNVHTQAIHAGFHYWKRLGVNNEDNLALLKVISHDYQISSTIKNIRNKNTVFAAIAEGYFRINENNHQIFTDIQAEGLYKALVVNYYSEVKVNAKLNKLLSQLKRSPEKWLSIPEAEEIIYNVNEILK
ncbi:hypothetical protein [Lactobacillus sp. PSON]|uniref:hypothetical protein n=1 Tax=Lactobacillus sp. PSON TaxID=3455454 RepID=UPI00404306DC